MRRDPAMRFGAGRGGSRFARQRLDHPVEPLSGLRHGVENREIELILDDRYRAEAPRFVRAAIVHTAPGAAQTICEENRKCPIERQPKAGSASILRATVSLSMNSARHSPVAVTVAAGGAES